MVLHVWVICGFGIARLQLSTCIVPYDLLATVVERGRRKPVSHRGNPRSAPCQSLWNLFESSDLTRCLSRNTWLSSCQYLFSNAPVSSTHLSPSPYNLRQVERRHINFFFHWHYSPQWTLACRTMSYFFLSATNSLHLLISSTWRSLSTSSFHLFLGLPVLEWRSFWACYPPFSLGDLTSLSFALLSILLYFLLCSSLLILDSSDFSIERGGYIPENCVIHRWNGALCFQLDLRKQELI